MNDEFEVHVNYRKNFSPTDIKERIEVFEAMVQGLGISKGDFYKMIVKSGMKLINPKITEEELEDGIDSLEDAAALKIAEDMSKEME